MLPEWKYNQIGRITFLVKKFLNKLRIKKDNVGLLENRQEVFIQLLIAIDDAITFYNLTKEGFYKNIESWEKTEKKLFDDASSIKEFYESWNDQASIQNTCVNIINQLIWFENYNICANYTVDSNVVIDYGCGTGSLSFGLALNKKMKNKLILLDVPNDIDSFRQYRIKEHELSNVTSGNIFSFKEKEIADLIICLDVLEHLEDSSDVFINKMYPLLKLGGYLILRAPWRGQMTHIDQAADDFYLNGGRKFLSDNFKEIYRFGSIDICAVYKKIK